MTLLEVQRSHVAERGIERKTGTSDMVGYRRLMVAMFRSELFAQISPQIT